MGARLYLPTLGRFLSVDPIEGGTLNPYVYAHDPVNGNDYLGLFCLQACSDVAAYLQPAAPATVLRSTTSSVIVSTPRKSYSATPVKVASQKSPSTVYVGAIAGGLSVADNLTDGIGLQSSVFGRELRAGSSIAAKNLKSASELANNSVVKVVGKYGGPIAVGLEFTGNYLEGDSVRRNAAKTGGSAVGGAIGAGIGDAVCGVAAFMSLGLGAASCPIAIGVLGGAGSWIGNKFGGIIADESGW